MSSPLNGNQKNAFTDIESIVCRGQKNAFTDIESIVCRGQSHIFTYFAVNLNFSSFSRCSHKEPQRSRLEKGDF